MIEPSHRLARTTPESWVDSSGTCDSAWSGPVSYWTSVEFDPAKNLHAGQGLPEEVERLPGSAPGAFGQSSLCNSGTSHVIAKYTTATLTASVWKLPACLRTHVYMAGVQRLHRSV